MSLPSGTSQPSTSLAAARAIDSPPPSPNTAARAALPQVKFTFKADGIGLSQSDDSAAHDDESHDAHHPSEQAASTPREMAALGDGTRASENVVKQEDTEGAAEVDYTPVASGSAGASGQPGATHSEGITPVEPYEGMLSFQPGTQGSKRPAVWHNGQWTGRRPPGYPEWDFSELHTPLLPRSEANDDGGDEEASGGSGGEAEEGEEREKGEDEIMEEGEDEKEALDVPQPATNDDPPASNAASTSVVPVAAAPDLPFPPTASSSSSSEMQNGSAPQNGSLRASQQPTSTLNVVKGASNGTDVPRHVGATDRSRSSAAAPPLARSLSRNSIRAPSSLSTSTLPPTYDPEPPSSSPDRAVASTSSHVNTLIDAPIPSTSNQSTTKTSLTTDKLSASTFSASDRPSPLPPSTAASNPSLADTKPTVRPPLSPTKRTVIANLTVVNPPPIPPVLPCLESFHRFIPPNLPESFMRTRLDGPDPELDVVEDDSYSYSATQAEMDAAKAHDEAERKEEERRREALKGKARALGFGGPKNKGKAVEEKVKIVEPPVKGKRGSGAAAKSAVARAAAADKKRAGSPLVTVSQPEFSSEDEEMLDQPPPPPPARGAPAARAAPPPVAKPPPPPPAIVEPTPPPPRQPPKQRGQPPPEPTPRSASPSDDTFTPTAPPRGASPPVAASSSRGAPQGHSPSANHRTAAPVAVPPKPKGRATSIAGSVSSIVPPAAKPTSEAVLEQSKRAEMMRKGIVASKRKREPTRFWTAIEMNSLVQPRPPAPFTLPDPPAGPALYTHTLYHDLYELPRTYIDDGPPQNPLLPPESEDDLDRKRARPPTPTSSAAPAKRPKVAMTN
ncbi:jumonji domain containing protein [Pseudohyphozyma bogoriensis]|nr:jumonji domain containing protein [Pseudohyphozyma bogoriensis]